MNERLEVKIVPECLCPYPVQCFPVPVIENNPVPDYPVLYWRREILKHGQVNGRAGMRHDLFPLVMSEVRVGHHADVNIGKGSQPLRSCRTVQYDGNYPWALREPGPVLQRSPRMGSCRGQVSYPEFP